MGQSHRIASFWRHSLLMFAAMRAGDAVNLVAGLWLVPKFVAPAELGAVLPVTTFATLLALPVFAAGMTVMKEAADLAGRGERGKLKSLWRGVFSAMALLAFASIAASAFLLPHRLRELRVTDSSAGLFAFAAAVLGAVAPVYTDALQATRRFKAFAVVEFAAAVSRLVSLAVAMPIRALVGYFLGNSVQPLVRIASTVLLVRDDLSVPAEKFWTRDNYRRIVVRFVGVLSYVMVPMAVANLEQTLVRTVLSDFDSAGYYVVTRMSDLLNYLTWPLLIVIFPYAAEAAREGRQTLPLVARTAVVTLFAAAALAVIGVWQGERILSLMPNGSQYVSLLPHLPPLVAVTALTACQTFFTNAEVAAGRFGFLIWFLPMNLAYAFSLRQAFAIDAGGARLVGFSTLVAWFLGGAAVRFVCAAIAASRSCRSLRPYKPAL